MVWVYQQQLNSIHVRSAQKWFNKKISVKFFKMLFYFQLFLLLFFTIAFIMLGILKTSVLNVTDTILIAGGLALLAAGIPAIIFITKGSAGSRSHRLHRRTHRDPGNEFPKNTEPS
jgi:cytochrome c biogenesis protein CcdA